jgi:Tfp pilus assembly PilM family ATPase
LDALGWSLDHVGCELEGLVHWFRQLKRPPAGAGQQEVSLVVDVDASTTTLLVLQRQQPRFHRSLGTGVEQLEDDPQHASERFVGELQRSIEAWEAEAGTARVQEIVMTGCVERLGALASAIERGVQLPVRVVAPPPPASACQRCRSPRWPGWSAASASWT